jgi:NAD(P)-dependent dehydrogenase (short-subunit alcohol dehydrogenase family)
MLVMREQKAGNIINISSTAGHRGVLDGSIYAASKHAVEGLTKSAALEGAEFRIRVNSVAPGPIDTGMFTRFSGTAKRKAALIGRIPLNRMGQPEEVAEAILFLASPKATFITDASIVVDGGRLA